MGLLERENRDSQQLCPHPQKALYSATSLSPEFSFLVVKIDESCLVSKQINVGANSCKIEIPLWDFFS